MSVNRKGQNISLKQSRYLLEETKSSQKGVWKIPLIVDEGNIATSHILEKKSGSFKLKNKDRNFIINSGRTGFYRMDYDSETLENLSLLIDEKILNYVDRWSIQNDYYSQCVTGKKKLQDYLDFTNAYFDEDNYISSLNLAQHLYSLYSLTHKEKFSDEIKQYAINFLRTIFERLGWDSKKGEPHTNALLRSFAISGLGKLGDQEILSESKKRFDKFLKNPNSLSADLQETVFVLVAWQGNESTYKKFLSLYKKAKSQEEKLRFLAAMCNFQQKKLLLKTLEFTLGPDVRSQNIQMPIMRIAANIHGKDFLWSWLKKNWKKIVKKAGIGNPLLNRVVASIGQVVDAKQEKEIRQFFKANPLRGTEMTFEQTMERVRVSSKFQNSIKKEFS